MNSEHSPRKMRNPMARIWSLSILIALPMVANACPICGSQTGMQVREAIFGKNFIRHAAWTLAPAPLLLAGVAVVCFQFPAKRPKKKESE
jgi:hypothetical protein